MTVSSFFFFSKYSTLGKQDRKEYLFKYIKRIFSLYLIWQLIYMPIVIKNWLTFCHIYPKYQKRLILFLYNFIFPGGHATKYGYVNGTNGWGASWYLLALMVGLPLFCALLVTIKQIFLFVFSVVIELMYILSSGYFFITKIKFWGILAFPRVFIYLFMGMYIASKVKHIEQLKSNKIYIITIVVIMLYFLENLIISIYNGNVANTEVFMSVPASCMLMISAMKWFPKLDKAILVRYFSTFLYAGQAWVIFIAQHFVIGRSLFWDYFRFVLVLLGSFLLFLFYLFINNKFKWKWLKLIV